MNSSEQLWRDIFAVGDNMRAIHADSRRVSMFYQMTVSQLKMVRAVYELTSLSGAGVALKVVAKELETTAAAASEMVDVLVRKKILERKQDPEDRRQVRIQLLPELSEHFKRVEEQFTAATDAFTATLSEAEKECFSRCAAKFNDFILRCGENRKEVK